MRRYTAIIPRIKAVGHLNTTFKTYSADAAISKCLHVWCLQSLEQLEPVQAHKIEVTRASHTGISTNRRSQNHLDYMSLDCACHKSETPRENIVNTQKLHTGKTWTENECQVLLH